MPRKVFVGFVNPEQFVFQQLLTNRVAVDAQAVGRSSLNVVAFRESVFEQRLFEFRHDSAKDLAGLVIGQLLFDQSIDNPSRRVFADVCVCV